MAGQELVLSVPGDRVPVVVPQLHGRPAPPVFRQVTLTVPEAVATWAEQQAKISGRTVEQVLAELVADGLDAKLQHSSAAGAKCPDGRPHQRGTINVRHCARCRARM
jgi:hypothetical protein